MLDLAHVAYDIAEELTCAKRPVLIVGWGCHLAKAESEVELFANRNEIPVVATWGAADLPNYGTFGTHGNRYGNFAVQNADYIVAVGTRLDTKATGSPVSSFAPKAKLVMVDVDESELAKMAQLRRPLYRSIQADAKIFLGMLERGLQDRWQAEESWSQWKAWNKKLAEWKAKYPAVLPEWNDDLNPYAIVQKLSKHIKPDDVIVSDTGCSLGWMMQSYPFKGERFIHAFNSTPMGYGLPAAIGTCFAAAGRRVVLITGDGGLSVNITEMATAVRHKLPLTVILFNNRGHAMCRQSQRMWLQGEYPSTSYEGGLATPDFQDIARSYGFMSYGPNSISAYGLDETLETVFRIGTCAFLEIDIPQEYGLIPQARFGFPIEDQEPAMSREELKEIMA